MDSLGAYLTAAVLAGCAAYRLCTGRRASRNPSLRYGYGVLILLAVTMILPVPPVQRLLAGLGVDGLSVILLDEIIRTAAISSLAFLVCALERRPVRGTPVIAAVLAQAAMITLFAAARPVLTAEDCLSVHAAGRWPLAVHDLVFLGYAEWVVLAAALALHRESRRVRTRRVRVGIRLLLAACAVGIAWAGWTVYDIMDALRFGVQDAGQDIPSNDLGALCAILIAVAVLVVKWHGPFASALARYHAYTAYRRLAPLWTALHAALPQLALEDGGGAPIGIRPPLRDPHFALYRRVIEIHDGRLALRPYAPQRRLIAAGLERTHEGGMRGADREALLEAASIAVALANHRAGRAAGAGEPEPDGSQPAEASGTMEAEAAWLTRVATAFADLRSAAAHPEADAGMYGNPTRIHLR
jgi:hypothetical protein